MCWDVLESAKWGERINQKDSRRIVKFKVSQRRDLRQVENLECVGLVYPHESRSNKHTIRRGLGISFKPPKGLRRWIRFSPADDHDVEDLDARPIDLDDSLIPL